MPTFVYMYIYIYICEILKILKILYYTLNSS